MSTMDEQSTPLPRRLHDGLDRLAAVLRADQWSAANAVGLNPTQGSVLSFLAGRAPAGVRVKAIAAHLGVTQPTATDSIAALERKQLIRKTVVPDDGRAVAVCITDQGREMLKTIGMAASSTGTALALLEPAEQAELLLLITKLIRSLQVADAIPVQRMCVTCQHFRPNIHGDAAQPHHCAFVNAAFGNRHLRLDCSDHEPAAPAAQAATWTAFNTGPVTLQAPNPI
ncbi:MAG: MarR family winged helix-turn-helix transcriptional regulator [Beijerinckiaceae bacterium]